MLLLTFKAIHGLAPSYISELVSIKETGGRYCLSWNDGILLNYPTCKSFTTLGWSIFLFGCPNIMKGSSPFFIRNTSSAIGFEAQKTHLFEKAFPS